MSRSLLEMQQQIRELDGKVRDISSSLASICNELDDYKKDNAGEIDFEMIRLMARHFPFGKHPLGRLKDAYSSQMYIEILLSIVQADLNSDPTISRLIFIQWILSQSRLETSLEELLAHSMKITVDTFGNIVEAIPASYREQLIVDALITANICGEAIDDMMIYIVNLCGIFGIEKKQLKILSIIVRGVLKQELGKMEMSDFQEIWTQADHFQHYLSSDLLAAGQCAQRTLAAEVPDSSCRNFQWKVKQQEQVKEGDVIATYNSIIVLSRFVQGGRKRTNQKKEDSVTEIKASCAGILFQFRNNNVNYGVIAHEYDNKDSIKKWALQEVTV